MCLRRHFFIPQKGKIREVKSRFVRAKMIILSNYIDIFARKAEHKQDKKWSKTQLKGVLKNTKRKFPDAYNTPISLIINTLNINRSFF